MHLTKLLPATHWVALAAAVCVFPAYADERDPADSSGRWGVGIGGVGATSLYRNFDKNNHLIPLLTYENRFVSLFGTRGDLKLGSTGPISLRARLRYAIGEGYKADDSPALRGMESRKAGLWLGGVATWRSGLADLSIEASGDVSGNSKGTQMRLNVERAYRVGNFELSAHIGATRVDQKYVDYYYGVRAFEVLPDRAFYQGRGATNAEAGLRVNYSLTPREIVLLDLSSTRFGGSVKDSPLVGRSTQNTVRLGYLFWF